MPKVLLSITVSERLSWCAFKQVCLIEKRDLEDLKRINPYFSFEELTGRHQEFEFYFSDLDIKIISEDDQQIENLKQMGLIDVGIVGFDLVNKLNRNYPQWRENIFDEYYDSLFKGHDSIRDYYKHRFNA